MCELTIGLKKADGTRQPAPCYSYRFWVYSAELSGVMVPKKTSPLQQTVCYISTPSRSIKLSYWQEVPIDFSTFFHKMQCDHAIMAAIVMRRKNARVCAQFSLCFCDFNPLTFSLSLPLRHGFQTPVLAFCCVLCKREVEANRAIKGQCRGRQRQ